MRKASREMDANMHVLYNVKHWLQSLSFKTGVIVLLCSIPTAQGQVEARERIV